MSNSAALFELMRFMLLILCMICGYKSFVALRHYDSAVRGSLYRIQYGYAARRWMLASIGSWTALAIADEFGGHPVLGAFAALTAANYIWQYKTTDFDDLDPFGSKLKKKLTNAMTSLAPGTGRTAPSPS